MRFSISNGLPDATVGWLFESHGLSSDSPTPAGLEITCKICSNGSLDPAPRVSGSAGLGWGLRICRPDGFPGDAAVAGAGTRPWRTIALKAGNGRVMQKASPSQLPDLLHLCADRCLHRASCALPTSLPDEASSGRPPSTAGQNHPLVPALSAHTELEGERLILQNLHKN